MSVLERVKKRVRDFQVRTNFGRSEEDNFTPWWIQHNFKTSDEEATMLSSDGNFEFGLDGFFIKQNNDQIILSLVQAKYTEDINQIRKGVLDINRFLPELSKIFSGLESDNSHFQENILIKRLRSKLSKTIISDSKQFDIEAYVITLHNSPKEYIENKTSTGQEEVRKTFNKIFSNPNMSFTLKILGIEDLIEDDATVVTRPPRPFVINFDGSETLPMNGSFFVSGIGKVSDLVELYERKGNQLFDKNVRLFLYGKKNETKGPAGKIKETLDKILSGEAPEKFAFLHNGVTIYSQKLSRVEGENKIELSNPSVLNGCQTIKSAYFFYQDQMHKKKLNSDIWQQIPISLRIVCTDDNTLWREVAEANNRQNSMKSSALRANDDVQIQLENRFRDMNIFYQRQEEAFENITRSDYELIDEHFFNSPREPITIETLAQTIICVSELPLSYATRFNEIFESHSLYEKVFTKKYLEYLKFLIFAHNVRRVMDLSINNAIYNLTNKFAKFNSKKYRNLFTRLVIKSLLSHKDSHYLIEEYGTEVLTRKGKQPQNLIEEIRKIIKSFRTPIISLVGDYFWDDNKNLWIKEDDHESIKIITKKLKLDNVSTMEIASSIFK